MIAKLKTMVSTRSQSARKQKKLAASPMDAVSPLAIETSFDDDSRMYKKGSVSRTVENGHDEQWENLSIPGIEASSTGATTPTSTDRSNDMNDGENQSESPSASSIFTTQSLSMDEKDAPSPSDDIYVSKEDLVLLLPTETYEEYESMVREDRDRKRSDRELRKKMIQQELDTLLRLMEQNEMEDGQELEPEAEEALGIAAYRLCYKQKYYDVARCDYVFVPSVAYTVMDGSLLDEASKHYYGQSEEFLVTYAAALGSAVLSQKNYKEYLNVGQKKMELVEDINLAENTSKNQQKNETVSDLFLGVASSRSASQSMNETEWDTNVVTKSSKRLSNKQIKKIKLAVGLYCVLAACFSMLLLFLNPQSPEWSIVDIYNEVPPTGPFRLFKSPSFLIPSTDLLKVSSNRYSIAEKPQEKPAMRMLSGHPASIDVADAPRRTRVASKRPIAANLLYHH
jgi:hypothetical protein